MQYIYITFRDPLPPPLELGLETLLLLEATGLLLLLTLLLFFVFFFGSGVGATFSSSESSKTANIFVVLDCIFHFFIVRIIKYSNVDINDIKFIRKNVFVCEREYVCECIISRN